MWNPGSGVSWAPASSSVLPWANVGEASPGITCVTGTAARMTINEPGVYWVQFTQALSIAPANASQTMAVYRNNTIVPYLQSDAFSQSTPGDAWIKNTVSGFIRCSLGDVLQIKGSGDSRTFTVQNGQWLVMKVSD